MSTSPTTPAPSSTQHFADDDPYLIIAADSHAGLPTEQYRDYLESRYHEAFDQFLSERYIQIEAATRMGVRDENYAKQWFELHDEELESGWDAIKRDQALDADGVVAEVVYPDADAVESRTCVPFGAGLGLSGDLDPELGMAGAKAHNRWLAELCSHSPERRKGVALVPITVEIDEGARRDPLGQGPRPRRGDDPGHVGEPAAVPRHQLRPGVGALRGAADAGRHPLRLRLARRVRRPPRHLRHRGHVVAGPPDVVPAVVGRVQPLPGPALRRHRGRLLVAAGAAVVVGPAGARLDAAPPSSARARSRPPSATCSRARWSTGTASPASPT